MAISIRDQLLALGMKPSPVAAKPPAPAQRPQQQRSQHHRSQQNGPQQGAQPQAPGQAPARPGRDRPQHARPQHPSSRPQHPGARPGSTQQRRDRPAAPKTSEEIDLAKAYALRANDERRAREAALREAEEKKREKQERKRKLAEILNGKTLNDAAAEIARNFEYGGKIRRIYVTPEQLKQLNGGELGVVQHDGRYLLVTREQALAVQALFPSVVALLHDPNAPVEDDVPPDLVW